MTAPDVDILPFVNGDDDRIAGLATFLADEEQRSHDGELDGDRAAALDFYNGEPFGDEEDGRSQVVTRDVAEVIDYATVSILRTMISGDTVVEFATPDKQLSKEIDAALNQQFFQGQDGYRVLHDWIKAGLLERTGVVKVCVEEQPPKRREAELTADEMAGLMASGMEMIAATPLDESETLWQVAYLEPRPPLFRDYFVPNEETMIAQDARDLDHDCEYNGFRTPRTVSQITEMGYDTSDLESDYPIEADELANARDGGSNWVEGDYRTGPNRRVWLLEEYARYDLDGDGVTELNKVHRVGSRILHVEPVDEQPGVVFCPFPMPGRIVGQSLADKVMDIQRTRSVLMRQGLDNLYQANKPRWAVSKASSGETTIDDLLAAPIAGGIIRYEGATPPVPVKLPDVSSSAFQMMEVLAGERESRTGITRLNQGLDADALNKTATGTAMMQAQGQQIEDYMARNFAEAFARLMLKKYRLMRAFGSVMRVMIDGQEVEVDPRQWPDDVHVRVRVGLGTGRKEQRLAARMQLLQIAQQVESAGDLSLFTPDNIYNQIVGVIEDSSLGEVNQYITHPEEMPEREPQPDPETLKAQAQAMVEAQKVENDAKKAQGDQMLKARQIEADVQLKQQQAEYDLQAKREAAALQQQLMREKAEFEASLALRSQAFEEQMAERRMLFEQQMAQQQVANAAAQQAVALPKKRPGGDLDK